MKVLIIGGGVGGLCLAHGLLKAGIEVQVSEQQLNNNENLAGYGIHINQDGRRALRTCLPLSNWTQLQTIFTPAGAQLYFRDTQLQLLAERDDAELSGKSIKETERCGIGRLELGDVLLSGLVNKTPPVVHWNKVFIHYDQLPDGLVRTRFSDGTFADGDLLVGADGPNSTVRHQYLPDLKRLDLGVSAIAGRYLLDKKWIENLPAEITDGSLNNIVPYGKGWMFGSAWKSRPADGNNYSEAEHYVVWAYVLPTEDIPQNVNGLDGSKLRDHLLEVTKGWSLQLRSMLSDSDTSSIKYLSLRSMPTLPKWDPSNVTLLGDAIHNSTPMGSISANTALQDAEVLSRHITDVAAGRLTIIEAVGNYQDEMVVYANEALQLSLISTNFTTGFGLGISGYGSRANLAQPFLPENIVLLYDGSCSSTCTLASEFLRINAGVKSVAFGGRPKKGPIQGVGGVKGSQVYQITDIFQLAEQGMILGTSPANEEALQNVNPLPIVRSTAGSVNVRDQIPRPNLHDGLPAQFVVEHADCRLYWTAPMVNDITEVWKAAANAAFNNAKCANGGIAYRAPKSLVRHVANPKLPMDIAYDKTERSEVWNAKFRLRTTD